MNPLSNVHAMKATQEMVLSVQILMNVTTLLHSTLLSVKKTSTAQIHLVHTLVLVTQDLLRLMTLIGYKTMMMYQYRVPLDQFAMVSLDDFV